MANLRYAEIVQQTNRTLSEYEYPLSLRQVYYRLVSQNTIPNTKSAYNSLSKMLVKAREVEDINEERIEDRARQAIESRAGYPSPSVFVQTMKAWFENSWQRYSLDLWTVFTSVLNTESKFAQVFRSGPRRDSINGRS